MAIDKFAVPGSLLTLDLVILSIINWCYWFLISKLVAPGEVGQATAIYSLVFLVSTIALLGLEYTLVKKASVDRSRILGMALLIQLSLVLISIPIMLYVINLLYGGSLNQLSWLAICLVVFYSLRYIIRFALLGIFDAKSILIVNSVGATLQLASGYILVLMGLGALGILTSILLNVLFVTCLTFVVARKSFDLSLGDLRYSKEILQDALINAPAAFSKTVIYSLCVILLAYFGISQADVGIFYIALMISFIVGSFGSNMALMAIPASLTGKRDLTADSVRIGLFITTPVIVALILEPKAILSLIGQAYIAADLTLTILSAAIFPYIVVTNAISSFNNRNEFKRITIIGLVQLFTFLVSFIFFVPQYGILGAGLSVLVSSIVSFVPSVMWFDRATVYMIFRCFLSLASGLAVGVIFLWIAGTSASPIIVILISASITLATGIGLKTAAMSEIVTIVRKATRFGNSNL